MENSVMATGGNVREQTMKMITRILVIIIVIFSLPATLPAAQKTMTTYSISPTATYPNNPNSPYNTESATTDKNFGVTKTGLGSVPAPAETSTPTPITDPETTTSFPPVVNDTSTPSITVDSSTGTLNMGSGIDDGSGAMWYGGTSPPNTCNPCDKGVCMFGLGFRAYFEFKYITQDSSTNSAANADGFTFTVMNAENNNKTKRGGAPRATFSLGELMGYAGSGNTSPAPLSSEPLVEPSSERDGLGLEPPKFAIEFDTYPNPNAMQYYGCSGNRNDHNNNNHIALMFWGMNSSPTTMCSSSSTAGNSYPRASFDDNVHGAGDGTTSNPYNSSYSGNGSGLGGYYERTRSGYNWMEDGEPHRVRIEAIRTSSTQTYRIKAWVDCEACTSTPCTPCPASEFTYFQDVYNPYVNATYLPKIDRTQQLSSTYNGMLDTIIFGFTEGTGASTQQFSISNFAIYFPTLSVGTPSNLSFPGGGGSGTVTLSVLSSCPWTTSNNSNTWISIAPASGTGSGSTQTITYTVAANPGAARAGTMTIAGQTFTISQAGCTYTVGAPSSLSFTRYGGNGTITVTASPSCPWTTSNNGNTWVAITPASDTGTGAAQTISYTVAANSGLARTGTMTIAGQTFTINQAGCTYTVGTPSNLSFAVSGGNGTASVDTSYSCTWTTSNNGHSWITITPAGDTGDGTADYTVAANNTGFARTGAITIAGQTFTINQAAVCTLTIADNSFACKSSTGYARVYVKVYLTDGSGNPVADASVTYSVSGGGGSGTLSNLGNGYYGGTRASNCGLGNNCVRTGSISGSRTVTVTATRAGCVGSPVTKTMIVP